LFESIDLAIEILLHRRHSRVSELHARTVPQILGVRYKRNAFLAPTCGMASAQRLPLDVRQRLDRSTS
jgi:hypothetical protein